MFADLTTLFKSLFATPVFKAGDRVNQFHNGTLLRTDGYVVAQSANSVLVEWRREGICHVSPFDLTVITQP